MNTLKTIGYSSHPVSGYQHLHFSLRVGDPSKSLSQNPLTVLPYTDHLPFSPVIKGQNIDATQRLAFLEIHTPDEEVDLAGLSVKTVAGKESGIGQSTIETSAPPTQKKLTAPLSISKTGSSPWSGPNPMAGVIVHPRHHLFVLRTTTAAGHFVFWLRIRSRIGRTILTVGISRNLKPCAAK